MLFKPLYHKYIYIGSLIIFSVAMNLSEYVLSISMFILIINWILEGNFNEKMHVLQHRKSILLFPGFYLLCVLTLMYSENHTHALNVLRLRLPLLFLPVIIGTSKQLQYKELKLLLLFFIAGTFVHTLVSGALFFQIIENDIHDTRNISYFFSHIRFSLILVLSAFICIYFFIKKQNVFFKREQYLYLILFFWFSFFIFLLKALTGIVAFGIILILIGFYFTLKIKKNAIKLLLVIALISIIIGPIYFFIHIYSDFYPQNVVPVQKLPAFTEQGNPYRHDFESNEVESGNYVWRYVSEKELRNEWNKRSVFDFDSLDKKGQSLKHTLIRYLTSKGYHKDSVGMSKLTTKDVQAIENGLAHEMYTKKFTLYPRVYELAWEVHHFRKTGNPKGSFTKRLLAYTTGLKIIKQHPVIGTGLGDIKKEYSEYYSKNKPAMNKERFVYGHNQFLTIWISMGTIGLICFIVMLFYPLKIRKGYKNYLFIIYFIIVFLSMLNDDTLDTQIGMAFFMFFYAVFLFGYNKRGDEENSRE